jgi:hypothetical protein
MIIMILAVTILLPTIPAEFFALASPNAFGQQSIFDNIDRGNTGTALDLTNNDKADHNVVSISTLGSFDGSAPSSDMTQTSPRIRLVDIINSTYTTPANITD